MQKLSGLFYGFLKIAADAQRLGLGMLRVAILVIFVWIGGLKFWNYEAEGIVPFVANSPFMSFFYNTKAPEYKQYKMPEGSFNADKHAWHVANNTYARTGPADHVDRHPDLLRIFLCACGAGG